MNPINIPKVVAEPPKNFKTAAEKIKWQTSDFLSKLQSSHTETIIEFLETKAKPIKIRSKENNLYVYDNILMYRTNGHDAYTLEQNLKAVEDSELAPKFAEYFQLGDDDFLTVMTVDAENIIPYSEAAGKISSKTKYLYKSNISKLISKGILNREIFANKDTRFVTSDGNRIFCADWGNISFLDKSEREQILKSIEKF